ncbi:PEP-CTERM sorting domain-containing protein [Nostoc sp.]|uniref:PEP-CTERM sorting domain-containing protein n=1 Tax=Nostoc sp. TaxID=1180 RepID=UPI002FF76BB1
MKLIHKTVALIVLVTTVTFSLLGESASAFTLTNGPGDGTVSIGVDGFGSFGLNPRGNGTNDALFDPIGAQGLTGTTFDSGVAIRLGNSGGRTFLTSGSIGGSGGLTNPTVTGTSTQANSIFSFDALKFNLVQLITPLLDNGSQTGTVLTQTYTITNTSNTSSDFELLRYVDKDLRFDGSLIDGGGRLLSGSTETLFETDSATGSNDPTTFVGISAEGGTVPAIGRYEIDNYSDLRSRIIAGTALDNTITGDGADADQFIDAGLGYDVTLALNNLFSIGAGQTTTYTTTTFFGLGAPRIVVPPTSVPEPSSMLGLLAVGTFGATTLLKRKQQKASAQV